MADELGIFIPANPYDESKEKGRFDPGTRILKQGWRYGKKYAPLPVDIVFEKDTAVPMRDGTQIIVDVFRPSGPSPFPASRRALPRRARRSA